VERLRTPQIITGATDEYRGEMDVIGNFIRERLTPAGRDAGRGRG
jgi:hypothetical protein